jgi:hypothetical protein
LPFAHESGLTYYQVWDKNGWRLNDGPQGLKRLDNVIETAGKYGIKIILAFTNNWCVPPFPVCGDYQLDVQLSGLVTVYVSPSFARIPKF